MIYLFLSLFMLFFKGSRLIFILISLEFMMMTIFFSLGYIITDMNFFILISFAVISSLLGLVIMIIMMKFYGNDMSLF